MVVSSLYVFLGGGIGAVTRYLFSLLSLSILKSTHWGTLFVNVLGAFLLYLLNKKGMLPNKNMDAAIKIGFLGGLTTFSTFSYEVFNFLEQGKLTTAMTHFGLNIVLGIVVMVIIFR